MNDKVLTLADYTEQIVRPMVLNGILSGSFDAIISNSSERAKCICVYSDDISLLKAIIARFDILSSKT